MPGYTGRHIAQEALRDLGFLDPIQPIDAEDLAQVLEIATDLLDTWQTKKLTLAAPGRYIYELNDGQYIYTIGAGASADFEQPRPHAIDRWGIIAGPTAAPLLPENDKEEVRGKPITWTEYSLIPTKKTDGVPTRLWYEGSPLNDVRGYIRVHPVPDRDGMWVVLYMQLPQLTALAANTTYFFKAGQKRALQKMLAVACGSRFKAPISTELKDEAKEAFADFRRSNVKPQPSPLKPGFAIGRGRRRRDLRGDSF